MVADTATDMTGFIYHERQVKELCALHALNNLFQERGFSKHELDQICYSLSPDVWINPHKSLLGRGNYDINVIMTALQRRGCEAVWFDKRRDPNCLCLANIEGFILNVPTEYKLGFVLLPLKRRHWIALKSIDGAFYNLDSKLDTPQLIGKKCDMSDEMKQEAMELCVTAAEKYADNYESVSRMIKETMDKRFGASWHTVVGEGYGFEITYQLKHLLYMYCAGNLAICIWKSA